MNAATQFRVAFTVSDFERALSFFRDVLGLPIERDWGSAEGRGVVLSIKQATLEILDPAHAVYVDSIEAGRRVSGQVRFAFEVPNLLDTLTEAGKAGVQLVNGPIEAPWKDLIARLVGPEGMQVTLFQSPASR